jgi:hypothetical protein
LDKEFFEKAYQAEYEEVKVEPTEVDNPQPVDKPVDKLEIVTPVTETKEVTELSKYNIDGEEYTIEQIKEWKLGNMRQADYSRKTQEVARQRKEMQDAVSLYEYIKKNPDVATALRDADYSDGAEQVTKPLTPEMQRVQELEYKLAEKELDETINRLKTKHSDFNEVEVMQECEKRQIYDLEFVYSAMKGSKESTQVDVEAIKKEAIEEAKKQLMAELQANTDSTTTIISSEGGQAIVTSPGDTLTVEEKRFCEKRGFDINEYAQWKTIGAK